MREGINMKLGLSNKSLIHKIETMQNVLKEAKDKSKKAEAQEEILLKQMQELFECESLDEGKELLEQIMQEKDEIDSGLESETDDLYQKMKADGLIE